MRIIQPNVIVPKGELDGRKLNLLERAGRICYQSEEFGSPEEFIRARVKDKHASVLEHEKVTVIFTCDRGVSHEIVRHRIAAYSQESTRYCNYAKEKFGKEITVIMPFFFKDLAAHKYWLDAMYYAEESYFLLLKAGALPQEARSVLPNSLKTQIMVTYDLREWIHFFTLRGAKAAHPQMRQLTIPLLFEFQAIYPAIFEGIPYDEDFPIKEYAKIIYE